MFSTYPPLVFIVIFSDLFDGVYDEDLRALRKQRAGEAARFYLLRPPTLWQRQLLLSYVAVLLGGLHTVSARSPS